jgi:hypothetical protein
MFNSTGVRSFAMQVSTMVIGTMQTCAKLDDLLTEA